jgi:hypothetical protein
MTAVSSRNLSPEAVQLLNNYTIWIKSNLYGEKGFYFGALCNPLGLRFCSNSDCGVYEVNVVTNEVIGKCTSCKICHGGDGIDADCTNIGSGKFFVRNTKKCQTS